MDSVSTAYDSVANGVNKVLRTLGAPVQMLQGSTLLHPESWPKTVYRALTGSTDQSAKQLRQNMKTAISLFQRLQSKGAVTAPQVPRMIRDAENRSSIDFNEARLMDHLQRYRNAPIRSEVVIEEVADEVALSLRR